MISDDDFQLAGDLIRSSARILTVAHLRPDGDALSSVCALSLFTGRQGARVSSFCQNKNNQPFSYLPGFNDIVGDKNKFLAAGALSERFDLILVADCGSLARTALGEEIKEFQSAGGKVIEFDHHPRIDDYADLELRDPSISSTAELIYDFLKANHVFLDRDLADCILTGILSDTGNFLYPSASDATMKAASSALSAGARYGKIVSAVLGGKDVAMMKLWGLALSRLKLNVRYQLAFAVISREDIDAIIGSDHVDGAAESDLFSGLAGFLSNASGAKAVMLLYEDGQGFIKGSLRSTPGGFLVNDLARFLGGGGHERAAGFSIPGRLVYKGDNWNIVN